MSRQIELPNALYEEREALAQALRNLQHPVDAVSFSDRFSVFVDDWKAAIVSSEPRCPTCDETVDSGKCMCNEEPVTDDHDATYGL